MRYLFFMGRVNGSVQEYILPKMVGESKVHLLLGVKNTRIQPVLLQVLPSGVGFYLSPFKDVWGKYSKFEELRRFQQKQGLTYSVLEDVEVREIICDGE